MKPILFSIGSFDIYGYGLMIALGIVFAIVLAEKRAPKLGLNADHVFNIGLWGAGMGLVGAKILYWIVELPAIIEDPSLMLDIGNGFVVYGGIIGGIIGAIVYCRIKKIRFLQYFDLVMPSVALGQAFGRIGCLLAGCCYGRETDGWFHIVFTESMIAPNGVKLIPTQLISSGADLLHCLVLLWISRRAKGDGQVGGFYLMFYSVGRTLIELLRNDPRGEVGGLSTSQFISLFIFLIGLAMVVICGRRGKMEPAVAEMKVEEATEAEVQE